MFAHSICRLRDKWKMSQLFEKLLLETEILFCLRVVCVNFHVHEALKT